MIWTAGNVICLNLGHLGLVSGAALEQVTLQGPAVGGWRYPLPRRPGTDQALTQGESKSLILIFHSDKVSKPHAAFPFPRLQKQCLAQRGVILCTGTQGVPGGGTPGSRHGSTGSWCRGTAAPQSRQRSWPRGRTEGSAAIAPPAPQKRREVEQGKWGQNP